MFLKWLILLITLMCLPFGAEAATLLVVAGGSGSAPCNPTPCAMQTALNAVVAGDTITAANGTYTGHYTTNGGAGNAGAKILIKATNQHGAIIQGASSSADTTTNEFGFRVTQPYYIIEGFDLRQHRLPIWAQSGGTNLEIRFNLISNFFGFGLWMQGGTSYIHENVLGQAYSTNDDNAWAGIRLDQTDDHRVQRNIIYGVTDNAFIQTGGGFGTNGYPIYINQSNDNLIQGNVMMDGAKNSGIRSTSATSCPQAGGPWASGNTIRDNIVGQGQGGGIGMAENARDSTVTNNLVYGDFFVGLNAKGNDPGNIIFTNNTVILTAYGQMGTRLETTDPCNPNTASLNTTLQNNLTYSSVNVPEQDLIYVTGTNFGTRSHNLFWSPVTPNTNWFSGYTPVGTDVLSQPVFTNAAQGDFSLQAGSPGKAAGSDSADMGIVYNSFLTKALAQKVVTLPVQEWTNPGGSTSHPFAVTAGRTYQTLIYLPDTGYFQGSQTYFVDGQTGGAFNTQTDAVDGGWVMSNPARYMFAGTWLATSSTLTVSWQNANAAGKVLIREFPTPAEAFLWLSAAPPFTGLVGHYAMDSGSGPTAIDSAFGNDGNLCTDATCPGASPPTWVTGHIGSNALSFDGTNDHVLIPDDPLLNFTSDFTVTVWVFSSQAAQAVRWPRLVAKTGGNTTGWDIILHEATEPRWTARIWIAGTPTSVYGDTNIADGSWHQIAVTRSGTTLSTYEDGQLANTGTVSGADLTNALEGSFGGAVGFTCCWLNGQMDNLRFYNEALDAAEILALFEGEVDTTPPAAPTNLRVVGS